MRNQRYVRSLLAAVAAVTVASATAHAQTPPAYELDLLGPTDDPAHRWQNYNDVAGDVYRNSTVFFLNPNGDVVGTTSRYSGSGKTAVDAGVDAWLWDGTTSQRLGFDGSNDSTYEYTVGSVQKRITTITGLNAYTQVIGTSERYTPTGTTLGADAWYWDGEGIQAVGLAAGNNSFDYSYVTGGYTFRKSTVTLLNAPEDPDDTQVAGRSERFGSDGTKRGFDAWVYSDGTTQQVGLFGTSEHQYTLNGGLHRTSAVVALNDLGDVVGTSNRYAANGTSAGADAWLFRGGQTIRLGLIGNNYQDYQYAVGTGINTANFRSSTVKALNALGDVAGTTNRYTTGGTPQGADAWVMTSSGTAQVGLTGTDYQVGSYRMSAVDFLNDTGTAAGTTIRQGVLNGNRVETGRDAWVWTSGNGTRQIGLTALNDALYETTYPGTIHKFRQSTIQFLNDAGNAAGTSNRYGGTPVVSLGQDAWVWNGSTTNRVGLIGGVFEKSVNGSTFRSSTLTTLNEAGYAGGTSDRYTPTGEAAGSQAWVWNGSQTLTAGLADGDARDNVLMFLNEEGQAAGFATRIGDNNTYLGLDAWFFDDDTNSTTRLRFSQNNVGYSNAMIGFLTDTGVVLGSYELFDGATSLGNRAFWWTPESGKHDLGTLVQGGLSPSEWRYLAEVYGTTLPGAAGETPGGAPMYIVGTGKAAGQTHGQVAFVMSAVVPIPEPTTAAAALAPLGLGLLARRRRA